MRFITFVAFLFIVGCSQVATRAPSSEIIRKNYCETFEKISIDGDTCPRFGVSYNGQRIGPGGSNGGCFKSSEAADDYRKLEPTCKLRETFGRCQILKRSEKTREGKSCPNFTVVQDGEFVSCYRTLESAQWAMRARSECVN